MPTRFTNEEIDYAVTMNPRQPGISEDSYREILTSFILLQRHSPTGTTGGPGVSVTSMVESIDALLVDDDLMPVEKIKLTMKKRHLKKHEREMLHKPTSDWFETPDGEICRSAETLVVKDIISKFTKK